MLKAFRIPIALTAILIGVAWVVAGPAVALIVAILGLLEITFSFDNAIVNAKILARMTPKWQKLFLTVGILIAVFGMRLLFPLIIVSVAAGITPWEALNLALTNPDGYAHHVEGAHAVIAAFGGVFLLMLFLDWLFDPERDIHWLGPIEKVASLIGKVSGFPVILGACAILGATTLLDGGQSVATAGLLGLITFLLVSGVDTFFEEANAAKNMAASGGLAAFLYLEVIDASFSFDGVVGAFAISNDILVIALGLGIGAIYVRSLTVYLTHKGTLNDYRYLEHGAHWAIGALAVMLLLSIQVHIHELITGLLGVVLISAAFINSIIVNKREKS